jgi:hypothetical protein
VQRDIAQRPPDIPRYFRFEAKAAQQVTDDRRDGGLPVGTGDGDVAHTRHDRQRQFQLADDRDATPTRGRERRGIRRNPRAGDHERSPRDSREVVAAQLRIDAGLPQRIRDLFGLGRFRAV